MESTGVYWIPVFQLLEARGLEVCLINAKQAASIAGRGKTDVCDAQWLQYLHACGLLRASHRPPPCRCARCAACCGTGTASCAPPPPAPSICKKR